MEKLDKLETEQETIKNLQDIATKYGFNIAKSNTLVDFFDNLSLEIILLLREQRIQHKNLTKKMSNPKKILLREQRIKDKNLTEKMSNLEKILLL